jgi:uncharacterized protein YcbK (DUF882 family)
MPRAFQYFKSEEFDCPCCGLNNMDTMFLFELDLARDRAGVPFIINSGYRCEKHNKDIGGVSESAHLKGLATDIEASNSMDRYKIIDSLLGVHFKRIGIGNNFVHVDKDPTKAKNVIWIYKK